MGSFLMADAFKQSVRAADIIGARFLVLDALNERAAKLYRRLGFNDLPAHEPRMLINMTQVRKAVAIAG
jgi:ribosomal protein S18 acetylase RimI-like enzyme